VGILWEITAEKERENNTEDGQDRRV